MQRELIDDVWKQGDFQFEKIGERTYVVYYVKTADQQIKLTGSSENHDIQVEKFGFRIEYIMVCADDATAKSIDIYVLPHVGAKLTYPPRIFSVANDVLTDRFLECGREYKFPASTTIRFKLNGTANKKIFVMLCLQRLGEL